MTAEPISDGEHQLPKKHLPELDGLRGIAVLVVMAFHFFLFGDVDPESRVGKALVALVGVGWSGVDLFFVLSGFLITGILYDSRPRPGYFRTFYSRRVLRIFPLYYLFLALSFFVLPRLDTTGTFVPVSPSDQFWSWAYLSNVRVALRDWSAITPTLRHFWSLAIEEQFYLVWPWIVFAVARRRLLYICAGMYFGAAALRIGLCVYGQTLAGYALAPTRMDALAVGAFLALLMREPVGYQAAVRWARPVLLCSALALVPLFVLRKGLKHNDPVNVALSSSLLSLSFGAILVLGLSLPRSTRTRKLLSSSVLRFFGKYSYALYVFHQPVAFYFSALAHPAGIAPRGLQAALANPAVYFVAAFAMSVVAALLSWHCCEKHFLKLKDLFAYKPKGSKGVGKNTRCEASEA